MFLDVFRRFGLGLVLVWMCLHVGFQSCGGLSWDLSLLLEL